ncbi:MULTISPECIES: hypothetical protein [Streptomyces]|uniref:Uncharacterized protein n=1 Tax=Streptomyces galilaeus TaxID=33899 RepID=A0ABW9IXC4_STRGJ
MSLQTFIRPPRVLVVVQQPDDWLRWAAAALEALGEIWGGCAGIVLPAQVAQHPALLPLLAQWQPDHIVAYQPSGAMIDELIPGTIAGVLDPLEMDATSRAFNEEQLASHPWPVSDRAVDEAVAWLRGVLGVNRVGDDHVQSSTIGDGRGSSDRSSITALSSVTERSWWGVSHGQVVSPTSLAFAMEVGVATGTGGSAGSAPSEQQWRAAVLAGAQAKLRPDVDEDVLPLLDPATALCISVSRGGRVRKPVVVLGDQPEDYVLAQLLRQVLHEAVWIPWPDAAWYELTAAANRLRNRGVGRSMHITSASLSREQLQERIDACWEARRYRLEGDEPEPRVYDVVAPGELEMRAHSFVVLGQAWDQPAFLPVHAAADGSLEAAHRTAAAAPPGLDPARHRWQVCLTSTAHPLPPHRSLSAEAFLAPGQSKYETFVRAADGGGVGDQFGHDERRVVDLLGMHRCHPLAGPGEKR